MKNRDEEKRAISKEFAKCLKKLQQTHSKSDEPVYSDSVANSLCNVLEAVFLHGLKQPTSKRFASYLRGQSFDDRPTNTYWSFVKKFTHRGVLAQLNHLGQITREVGMCRAWVRIALNDGIMESYLESMLSDTNSLQHYYEVWGYLRDLEQPGILISYLQGLTQLTFKLSYNSSVLNMWTNAPLALSGLYDTHTPAPVIASGTRSPHPKETSPIKFPTTHRTQTQSSIETGYDATTYNFQSPVTPNNTPLEAPFFTSSTTEEIKKLASLVRESPDASTSSQISCPDPPRRNVPTREELASISIDSHASFDNFGDSLSSPLKLDTSMDFNTDNFVSNADSKFASNADSSFVSNVSSNKAYNTDSSFVSNVSSNEPCNDDDIEKRVVVRKKMIKTETDIVDGKTTEVPKRDILVENIPTTVTSDILPTSPIEQISINSKTLNSKTDQTKIPQIDKINPPLIQKSSVYNPLKAAADEKVLGPTDEKVLGPTDEKVLGPTDEKVGPNNIQDAKKTTDDINVDNIYSRNEPKDVQGAAITEPSRNLTSKKPSNIAISPESSNTLTSQTKSTDQPPASQPTDSRLTADKLKQFGNRLSSQRGWSSPFDNHDAGEGTGVVKSELQRDMSYRSVLLNYEPSTGFQSTSTVQQLIDGLPHSLHVPYVTAAQECDPETPTPTDYEFVSLCPSAEFAYSDLKQYESQLAILGQICNEKGLDQQNFQCYHCSRPIGLIYGKPRVCTYDGGYYCRECHENDELIIPSRVLYNWDFTKHKVAKHNKHFLGEVEEHPLLNIEQLNSKLYGHVRELNEIKDLRIQLLHLKSYIFTCQMTIAEDWRKMVWPKEYLYDGIHLYSISDLNQVSSGVLATNLRKIIKFAVKHIYECRLCSQKGFICEICHNPRVIYPFQTDDTYRCKRCKAVYHKTCKTDYRPCPKCQRRNERKLQLGDDSSSVDTIDYST